MCICVCLSVHEHIVVSACMHMCVFVHVRMYVCVCVCKCVCVSLCATVSLWVSVCVCVCLCVCVRVSMVMHRYKRRKLMVQWDSPYFIILHVCMFYPHICLCRHMCTWFPRSQKRMSGPLHWNFGRVWAAMYMSSGNQIQVLWKNNQDSQPLSHLAGPWIYFLVESNARLLSSFMVALSGCVGFSL